MSIVALDTTIVSVPFTHVEVSSRVYRGWVTDVIVKLSADNGLVGWGDERHARRSPWPRPQDPGDHDMAPAALLVAEIHGDLASLFRMAGPHIRARWSSPNKVFVIDAPIAPAWPYNHMFATG